MVNKMANKKNSKKSAENKSSSKSSSKASSVIALNRKATHLYHLEESFEAGLQLSGWEVKSLRAGKAQISDAYIIIKKDQAWLLNAHISPLLSASTHVDPEPARTRKLLLNRREINKLTGQIKQSGYTIVPTKLYWKRNFVKLAISLAIGKKDYDKRQSLKDKDWERQKSRIMRKNMK